MATLGEIYEEYRDGINVMAVGAFSIIVLWLVFSAAHGEIQAANTALAITGPSTTQASLTRLANLVLRFEDELLGVAFATFVLGILIAVIGRIARRVWKTFRPEIKLQIDDLKATLIDEIRTSKLPLVIQASKESEAKDMLINMIAKGYGPHCLNSDGFPQDLLNRFAQYFDGKQPYMADHTRVITISPSQTRPGAKSYDEVTSYYINCSALEGGAELRSSQEPLLPFKLRYHSEIVIDPTHAWTPSDYSLKIEKEQIRKGGTVERVSEVIFSFSTCVTLDTNGNLISSDPACKVNQADGILTIHFEKEIPTVAMSTRIQITETSTMAEMDNMITLVCPQPSLRAKTVVNLQPGWHFTETVFNHYGDPAAPTWNTRVHPQHVLFSESTRWVPPGQACVITYDPNLRPAGSQTQGRPHDSTHP